MILSLYALYFINFLNFCTELLELELNMMALKFYQGKQICLWKIDCMIDQFGGLSCKQV